MSYTSKLKKSLNNCINNLADKRDDYCFKVGRDFTRKRKSDFQSIVKVVLCFGGKSLNKELLEYFGFSPDILSASAFIQQKAKIKPEAFYQLFKDFTHINQNNNQLFHGYRLLAVDGSDIYTPKNSADLDSLSRNQNSSFNLYHLNALYDLLSRTYSDAVVQKYRFSNEHKAYVSMVDSYDPSTPAIIISDRGYESYNNLAHVQQCGLKFLSRLKDINSNGILSGFDLPAGELDISFDLNLTRKQTIFVKSNPFYHYLPHNVNFDFLPSSCNKSGSIVYFTLHLRFVRINITDDHFEALVTNLDENEFPPALLKELYAMRWEIETSFRSLKYSVGLSAFHSKKSEHILQEIFARLIIYNFSELVTSHIAIRKKKRKLLYKINFSVAVYSCRNLLLGRYAPKCVEAVISKHILPFRPNLSKPRKLRNIPPASFSYRVA